MRCIGKRGGDRRHRDCRRAVTVTFIIDFFIKLVNKFPSRQWWGEYKNGKLYPVEGKVLGFAQLVMKKFNGISERNLTLFFIGLEILVGLFVLALFLNLS